MVGTFESFASSSVNPAAEISRGIARGMQEQNAKSLLAEINQRETLAKRFEQIEQDRAYDQQSRDAARNYAIQLRMLPPTDKRPKDFLPDKSLEKQLGVSGIEASPAWVRVTLRKKTTEGPKEPAQPAEPADPFAQMGAPPSFDQLMTADGAAGAGTGTGADDIPAAPGGQQLGPNQITAAPAVPGAPSTLPPPPSIDEPAAPQYVSARRSPEDLAREDAELARIRNSVSLEPDASGLVDSRALPALGRQQTTAIQLRKLGLAPDGSPLPLEQLTPHEQQKIAHLRAQDELVDAQIGLAQARTAYEQQRDDFTRRTLEIAEQNLMIKQQNANTAATRVQMESALYGGLLNGGGTRLGGGAQGFLGGPDMGIGDPVESFAEQVLTNQIEFSTIPPKIKPLVSLKIAQRGGVIVPEKLQGKLMQFTEAKEAVDTVQSAIRDYQAAEGTEALWAAYNLNSKVDGLSRIVGRALGEKGVFTDADKADFRKIMSPGLVLTLSNPDRASKWIGEVNGILQRVEQQQLQGFYQRVYARRDQTLDTYKPGDTKNVVGVLDGGGNYTPGPASGGTATPQPVMDAGAIPPPDKRVAGVTRATIGGVERVWNGTGWARVKK